MEEIRGYQKTGPMNLYSLSILIHIIGITMLAGTTLVSFIANRRFWHLYGPDKVKAIAIMELGTKFPAMQGIGMLLLILSGISLMVQTRGVYAEQLWFRVKMILLIIIIVNAVIARRLGKKIQLQMTLQETNPRTDPKLMKLRSNTTLFYVVQLFLLLVIFVLGVFKIN